jgi:hypothetical protein
MDETLNKIEFEDEVSSLLRVACDCVHPILDKRPTMLEVYNKMGNIWEKDEIFDEDHDQSGLINALLLSNCDDIYLCNL